MNQYRCNKKRGFTLVEMLFYIAILVILSTALVLSFLSLNTVLQRNKVERTLTEAAQTALERMGRDIRQATAHNPIEQMLPGALAVDTDTGTTTEFFLDDGRLVVAVNDVVVGPLTPESVTVESIVFTRYEHTAGEVDTEAIRVALTLSVATAAASTTKTFYTTGVPRGSYE